MTAPAINILTGDVREQLKSLPDASFDCCVTSPPYWGLRDYGVAGQIGLEPTLGEHIEVLIDVFREVRRVLKPRATLWLNYGDCYAAHPNGKSAAEYKSDGSDDRTFRDKPFSTVGPIHPSQGASIDRGKRDADRWGGGNNPSGGILKPKDLCMIPNRLAIALQEDGWYVRSEIIWHKPNPMPESVYDRPTSAHEKIWLLTKSEDYFYDHAAIREPVTGGAHARKPGKNSRQNIDRTPRSRKIPAGWDTMPGTHGKENRFGRNAPESKMAIEADPYVKYKPSFAQATGELVDSRNARNVWTIAPKAFREAHFATFPPDLAARCIMAGTPRTVCGFCGAPDGCGGICESYDRIPGHVLDPFGGAGTVGMVARQLGRTATLIELNPDYVEITKRRLAAGTSAQEVA